MRTHLNQCSHNQELHTKICEIFPDSFYDWKITILFYIALHFIKAYFKNKGIDIGHTHIEIEKNINPLINYAPNKVDKDCWNHYKALLRYSQTARYDGLSDFKTFENSLKADHEKCLQHLEGVKNYLKKHNFQLTPVDN